MATGRLPDPNSAPVTAKGDLYTYSTVPAKLAVGSNGETLVADSSTTTGLRWTATPSASNPVLNSSFDIWQRGTTISSAANVYSADRWLIYRSGANLTTSRVATGDTTNLPNIQYAAQLQRTASSTNLDIVYFVNMFETVNSIPFAGKTVTLSYYARAGANYSPTGSSLTAQIQTGTGTDQNWISGYTGVSTPLTANATLTTTWQRFTVTGTIAATATELSVIFSYTPTGTAGANDWVQITGVQIDIGSVALPFRRNSATLAGELAACQRYFIQMTQQSGETGEVTLAMGMTTNGAATGGCICLNYGREMRTKPTITISNLKSSDQAGWTVDATLNSTSAARVSATINVTHAANGAQYRPEFLVFPSAFTSNAYLRLDAEL